MDERQAAALLPSADEAQPIALVVIGMAGAGKSTFVTALYTYLTGVAKKRVYCLNLDPAVDTVPFPCNVDIRDTVNYKNVMREYGLGPNGAILTSLNLFATKFDGVLKLIEKRKGELDFILLDTPGQIEVFNWSASGTIILETLSLVVPTAMIYLMDSVRCQVPTTLMSTLMYSCSLSLKSKLSTLNVFTKSDLVDSSLKIEKLITDYTEFCDAAEKEDTYSSTLAKSCCLSLQEFYSEIPRMKVAVNADTHELMGFAELYAYTDKLKEGYFKDYIPWIQSERERVAKSREKAALARLDKFEADEEDE